VVAAAGMPVIDQAASVFEWFQVKSSVSIPSIKARAFVTFMTEYLGLATVVGQRLELVEDHVLVVERRVGLTDYEKLIQMVYIRNHMNPTKDCNFDDDFVANVDDGIFMDFDQVKRFFEEHVAVCTIDCTNMMSTKDSDAMATTERLLREYEVITGKVFL